MDRLDALKNVPVIHGSNADSRITWNPASGTRSDGLRKPCPPPGTNPNRE